MTIAVAALALGLLGAAFGTPGLTPAAGAAGHGTIGPGIQMVTAGRLCTGNFVFRDWRGRTFVGYAAHCARRTGEASQTDGCASRSHRNVLVRFARGVTATSPGTTVGWGHLYWSSWRAMRRTGVHDWVRCHRNDFALVKVDRAYVRQVNPTVPFWGGPTGLAGPPLSGGRIFTYGSFAHPGEPGSVLAPKSGHVTQRFSWGATVFTPSVGVPGDVGSGFMDNKGRAAATLSTLADLPRPGTNGVGALAAEVKFANCHGLVGLRLVKGREPFSRSAVG